MSYIYKELTFFDFCDEFNRAGRKDQFSYGGKRALYDYIIEMAEASDLPFELDVVALCAWYAEYDGIEGFHEDYDPDEYPDIESIEQKATVMRVGKTGFIVEQF